MRPSPSPRSSALPRCVASARSRAVVRACAVALLLGLGPLGVSSARADNGVGDGLYGRLRHDFFLQLGVGAGAQLFPEAQPGFADEPSWAFMVDVRARMTGVAGIILATSTSRTHTTLFLGAEVRPLYPALVLKGIITGRARADLTIQSLYIELGSALRFQGTLRTSLGWGLGFEVPLVLPRQFSQGVWLRFGVRHFREARQMRDLGVPAAPAEWLPHVSLAMTLGVSEGRFAGWEPPRTRP
ncbi:MAG: hypothetical protein H6726_31120 [Sandaracinaceae bacterium]|nr:hypothetical protein [Myxococcales bacterium]MCB9662134.1 hypothetical protein [Sandaracinaceae bacterium]